MHIAGSQVGGGIGCPQPFRVSTARAQFTFIFYLSALNIMGRLGFLALVPWIQAFHMDGQDQEKFPIGAHGAAAIYTEGGGFAVLRKITIRAHAWLKLAVPTECVMPKRNP